MLPNPPQHPPIVQRLRAELGRVRDEQRATQRQNLQLRQELARLRQRIARREASARA
jgi:hypothetical protein